MIDDLRLPKDAPPLGPSAIASRPSAIWRSLEEQADPEAFRQRSHNEFSPSYFSRRNFLKLMGASVALAGLPACTRQPVHKIVPYVRQPEDLLPGRPMYFATAMTLGGFGTGLIVESHEGHPTKIEGNPDHPASLGATSIFHQAALLDLYDPDRSQAVLNDGQPDTWENFVAALHDALSSQQSRNGGGLRILTETVSSPTLASQIRELRRQFPGARWHQYEPVNRDNVYEGSKIAFAKIVETHFHFDKARIIVALEPDFLSGHPNSVRYARHFAQLRRARFPQTEMSRFYAAESVPSVTGANADHRLVALPSQMEAIALALAEKLGAVPSGTAHPLPSALEAWVAAAAADLRKHRGESIVSIGAFPSPALHALGHHLNQFLGNFGRTVTFTAPAMAEPVNQAQSLRDLVEALDRQEVEILLILGGNPAFTAPAEFAFADRLSKAKFSVHLAPDLNETSKGCRWHIPQNHFLESWSDTRAFDGTVSIVQPLILPLYAGKSAHEVLEAALAPPGRDDYEIVRSFWNAQDPDESFDSSWRKTLHDGLIEKSALPKEKVSVRPWDEWRAAFMQSASAPQSASLEIIFRPDPTIFDGRFANNGWLQELPKPMTKIVWDNAALISPALASREGLKNGDVIEIALAGRQLRIPVWINPGQADSSIALHFGYGREHVGHVGRGTGFNIFPLRTSVMPWSGPGATIKKTGDHYQLVTMQSQHVIDSDDRQIFRDGTFAQFQSDPDFVRKQSDRPADDDTLFNPGEYAYNGYRWGMAIDLSACIGCSACVVACYAENNIPVVGKQQAALGRVMDWIRVDQYFRGPAANPEFVHQPVPCMQCENAPCEVVCPVGATLHDKEGLNLQEYQRCIGTRYCSNNCPYKVRRFNFLEYADYRTPSLMPMRNPNVTVRWRGVMEKCTYCIQRINAARIRSEEQNRTIRDGEIQTACMQACPADAIVFGNIGDPTSRVSKLKAHPLNFAMLGQLNTRPRTTYLAKLRNPNPKFPT